MFRAFDQKTERLVAVKLFTLDLPPERVHQLVAELERLIDANLTHPAIAAPLATGIHDNRAYLAMEYVSADSLDTAIRQYGAAPPADALRVAAQLAGALDFAAVVHIAHGALHPRDVLLSPEETRLTGLGIAAAFERVQIAAPVRRPYTPPEGIAGADWDRRADVFSLAALMHELLWARRVPAIGAQAGVSLTQIPGGDLIALRTVFARALAERPADRFDTALEFAQALTLAFPDVAIAAPRAGVEPAAAVGPSEIADSRQDQRLPLDEPLPPATARPVKKAAPARPEPVAPSAAAPHRADEAKPVVADQAKPVMVRPSQAPEMPQSDAAHADLHLREAEAARYQDVETAHSISDLPPTVPDGGTPAELVSASSSAYESAPISALERSRSAIWPLSLALLVGLAIGFASGYGVGNRDRSGASQAVAASKPPAASAPATNAERDLTEAAVNDPKSPPATEAPQKPETTAPGSGAISPRSAPAGTRTADPPVARGSGTSDGRLLVRSTPAGARVFVDGREEGRTPVAVRELARGEHRLRVVRDGYATEERRITITASRPAQAMTVPLSPVRVAQVPAERMPIPATPGTTGRFVGALTVDSRPPSAKVFIDGKLVGSTPLQLAGLDAGEHVVRIELDGYRRWSSSVRVVASEQNRVTASLEK